MSLKFYRSSNFSLLAMTLLIAFTVWYDFFETYLYHAKTPLDAICLGQIAFTHSTKASPMWAALFLALQIGLFEELTRYVFILICLNGFKNSPYKVWLAILFSTLEFSLGHAPYIFFGESLTYVIIEVVFTFGFGALMAVLYLYSGKLWLAIIGHGLCDFAGMVIVNNSAGFLSRYDSTGYLSLAIITVLPLAAAVIMMTGKRGKLIKENAIRLTKSEDEPTLS